VSEQTLEHLNEPAPIWCSAGLLMLADRLGAELVQAGAAPTEWLRQTQAGSGTLSCPRPWTRQPRLG